MKTETKKIIPASAISFSLLVHLAVFLSVSSYIIIDPQRTTIILDGDNIRYGLCADAHCVRQTYP